MEKNWRAQGKGNRNARKNSGFQVGTLAVGQNFGERNRWNRGTESDQAKRVQEAMRRTPKE